MKNRSLFLIALAALGLSGASEAVPEGGSFSFEAGFGVANETFSDMSFTAAQTTVLPEADSFDGDDADGHFAVGGPEGVFKTANYANLYPSNSQPNPFGQVALGYLCRQDNYVTGAGVSISFPGNGRSYFNVPTSETANYRTTEDSTSSNDALVHVTSSGVGRGYLKTDFDARAYIQGGMAGEFLCVLVKGGYAYTKGQLYIPSIDSATEKEGIKSPDGVHRHAFFGGIDASMPLTENIDFFVEFTTTWYARKDVQYTNLTGDGDLLLGEFVTQNNAGDDNTITESTETPTIGFKGSRHAVVAGFRLFQ